MLDSIDLKATVKMLGLSAAGGCSSDHHCCSRRFCTVPRS